MARFDAYPRKCRLLLKEVHQASKRFLKQVERSDFASPFGHICSLFRKENLNFQQERALNFGILHRKRQL